MSDEYAEHLIQKYFPELRDLPENGSEYCLVQGRLYEELIDSTHVDRNDAMHVSRFLNRGEIEEAEQKVRELLEEDQEE